MPESGEQDLPAAREPRAEHAHAVDLAFGRDRTDDAGAGRAVPAKVAFGVLGDDRLAVLARGDEDRARDLPDERMPGLDPAVEDADADAPAGRPPESPVAGDRGGPFALERDPLGRAGGQAPGGELGPAQEDATACSSASRSRTCRAIARFCLRS